MDHCQNIDFTEEISGKVQESLDFVTNIAIDANQFDLEKLYGEAQKLGLDLGDLEEYGFDLKNYRHKIDNYEEFREKVLVIGEKGYKSVSDKISQDYAKARCNPMVEKYLHPYV